MRTVRHNNARLMKIIASLVFFSAVCCSATPDQQREPALWPAFYVVRTQKLESLDGAWIRRVTVTITKCEGYFLNAVPSDWLVSCRTKDGVHRVDFYPWPVPPGERIKKFLHLGSLDQVILVDPSEDPGGMPVLPRVSLTIEYFKDGLGLSSTEAEEPKVELRHWTQEGLTKPTEPTSAHR